MPVMELSAEKLAELVSRSQLRTALIRDIEALCKALAQDRDQAPLVAEPPPAVGDQYPDERLLMRLGGRVTIVVGEYRISALRAGMVEPGRPDPWNEHHIEFGDGLDRPWLNDPAVNQVRVRATRMVYEQALAVRRAELESMDRWLADQDVRIVHTSSGPR